MIKYVAIAMIFFLSLSHALLGQTPYVEYILLYIVLQIWQNGALVGMVWLILEFVPGSRTQKAYSILVVFPLLILSSGMLLSVFVSDPNPWYSAILYGGEARFLEVFVCLIIATMIVMIGLRTVLSTKDKTPSLYAKLVFTSLAVSTTFYLLFRVLLEDVFIYRYVHFSLVLVPTLGTILIGTLRRAYQHVAIGMVVLWIMIAVAGWIRLEMIDDGLGAFTGGERVNAENALKESSRCDIRFRGRVVRDEVGDLRVLGYTWWGLPSRSQSCGPYYRQWNRW